MPTIRYHDKVYEYEFNPHSLASLPAGVATAVLVKREEEFLAKEMFPVWARQLRLPGNTVFSRNLTEGGDEVPEGGSCWDYELECEGCDGYGTISSHNISKDCPCCDGFGRHEGGLLIVDADYQIVESKEEM